MPNTRHHKHRQCSIMRNSLVHNPVQHNYPISINNLRHSTTVNFKIPFILQTSLCRVHESRCLCKNLLPRCIHHARLGGQGNALWTKEFHFLKEPANISFLFLCMHTFLATEPYWYSSCLILLSYSSQTAQSRQQKTTTTVKHNDKRKCQLIFLAWNNFAIAIEILPANSGPSTQLPVSWRALSFSCHYFHENIP